MPAKAVKGKKPQAKVIKQQRKDKLLKEQRELGFKTAKSLILELEENPEMRAIFFDSKKRAHLQLSEPIEITKFFSYQKDKEEIHPIHDSLKEELKAFVVNPKSAAIFCYATLKTDSERQFDLDHVCPRAYFIQKQKKLLKYLNDNKEFAKGFLGEVEIKDANDETYIKKIKEYFGQDKSTGEIKATNWFYLVCYNSINNLSYLTHYINCGKGAKPIAEWLSKSVNLPKKFTDD